MLNEQSVANGKIKPYKIKK